MKFILSVLIYACLNVVAFAMSEPLPSNSNKTDNSIENVKINIQSVAFGKTSCQRLLKHLKKCNSGDDRGVDKRLLLVTVGLVSLALVSWAFGFQLLSMAGLAFFTIATGIGYLISSKNQGERKNRFPKAMFIAAIVLNFLIASGLTILSLLIPFD